LAICVLVFLLWNISIKAFFPHLGLE
jgi:hypothetical protein